jgi:hypothetical protein
MKVIFLVPVSKNPAIHSPVALVKEAIQVDAAHRSLRCLDSEPAVATFKRAWCIVRD